MRETPILLFLRSVTVLILRADPVDIAQPVLRYSHQPSVTSRPVQSHDQRSILDEELGHTQRRLNVCAYNRIPSITLHILLS